MAAANDLTRGPIAHTLLMFALPTLGSNILQSLSASINMVWIGHFLGESALAATSNATNLIFLAFSALFGFGMAATVLVGQHIGRHDLDGARRAVAAAATLLIGVSIVVMLVGIASADELLRLMATPPEALPLAVDYLRMMLLGLPLTAAAVLLMMSLRGAGDAMTPLWFTIVGIVVGAGLNPFLIAGIGPFPKLGIVGAAVAILIANLLTAAGMLATVYVRDLPIRLRGSEFRYLLPQMALLRLIVGKGFGMGLQILIFSISGLVMMGLANRGGVNVSAAYGVALQLWNYVLMPAMAIGAAVTAMAAQNIGAGRWDRVGAITRSGVYANIAMTGALIVLLTLFDRLALGLFLGAASPAVPVAEHIQRIAGSSFLFMGVTMVLFSTMRANGAVLVPTLISLAGLLVFRIAFAIWTQPWLGFDALWWAFPVSSMFNCGLAALCYLHGGWRRGALADEAERAEQVARAGRVSEHGADLGA